MKHLLWLLLIGFHIAAQPIHEPITVDNVAEIVQVAEFGQGAFYEVVFSDNGQWVAAIGAQSLWLIHTETTALRYTVTPSSIMTAALSPDGRLLVFALQDNTLHFWDVERDIILETFTDLSVTDLDFSPDGTTLAVVSGDIFIWDTETREHIDVVELDLGTTATLADFSPDGNLLAWADNAYRIMVWDMETSKIKWEFPDHLDDAYSVQFSPDSSLLASGFNSNPVILWDVVTGEQISINLAFWREGAFSNNSTLFAHINDFQPSIVLINAKIPHSAVYFDKHPAPVNSIVFNSDDTLIVSGSADGTIHFWDVKTKRQLLSIDKHENEVMDVAFSPDGTLLASAGLDGRVILWAVDVEDD